MYKIEIDPARQLLKLTLNGAIPIDAVQRLMRECQAAVQRLACPSGEHLTLIDALNSTVHPKDVAAAFSSMVGQIRHRARRVAIVENSALWRLQTRRILQSDRVAFFGSITDAEYWLLSGHEPPAKLAVANAA